MIPAQFESSTREDDPGGEGGIGDAGGLAEQTNGEPSLGSFDRMLNQEKSYRQRDDGQMHWDNAEADPAEAGIADADALGDPANQPMPPNKRRAKNRAVADAMAGRALGSRVRQVGRPLLTVR